MEHKKEGGADEVDDEDGQSTSQDKFCLAGSLLKIIKVEYVKDKRIHEDCNNIGQIKNAVRIQKNAKAQHRRQIEGNDDQQDVACKKINFIPWHQRRNPDFHRNKTIRPRSLQLFFLNCKKNILEYIKTSGLVKS